VESIRPGENIDTYYQPDRTGKIRGPYEPTLPSTHEAEYSPLFLQADLCAGCHEYANEYGVTILGTFSEWSESPYPGNDVHCQNCHMPIMPDLSVVDGRQVPNYYVTAHEFRGGHSNINLEHAVSLETTARRDDERIEVLVSITNSESGHKLPTGIPIRKIVLDVVLETDDGFTIGSAGKVYRKVLTDKYGTIIENAPDMFLNATAVFSDNRIRPKETRVEKFTFVLPEGVDDYRVETTLNYEHSRPVLKEEHVRIPMASNTVLARDIE